MALLSGNCSWKFEECWAARNGGPTVEPKMLFAQPTRYCQIPAWATLSRPNAHHVMKPTNHTAQKQRERVWFHKFRDHCPACPRSVPQQPSPPAPDILLTDNGVGIELTTYLLGQGTNGSHPRRLEVVRREIVRKAQLAYEGNGKSCLQVSVIWSTDVCPGRRDIGRLIEALSRTVAARTRQNQRIQTSWRLGRQDFEEPVLEQHVEEIGVLIMAREGRSCWSSATGLCFGTCEALVNRFQDLLNRKEANVTTYLKSCREEWLLIIAEGQWFSSNIGSNHSLLQAKFESSFSRVFVLDEHYAQVFELTIHKC